nr:hypothetical protein [Tanacetum cinerariifolium]
MTPDKGITKTTPRPEGSLGDKDSEGNIPPTNMELIHTIVANPSGTGAKFQDELDKESDEEEVLGAGEDINEDPQVAEEVGNPPSKQDQPEPSHDTSKIESMMIEIYQAFKGHLASDPSGSVTLTLTLTNIPVNVEGENTTTTAIEEPPCHTKGETEDPHMAILISSIEPTKILQTQAQPITSTITHLESSQAGLRLDNGKRITTKKMYYLTNREMQAYLDKEEKIKKAVEEAKLLDMFKPEIIKVVREEANKLGINPKEAISTKDGEQFKKAQDAEHEVLKREHSKKVKRLT